jgi:hypothetical protein
MSVIGRKACESFRTTRFREFVARAQSSSNLRKLRYFSSVKPVLPPTPTEPEKLKPALHDKIEQMDAFHLSVLNRILLQLEAEELAGHLSEEFGKDREQGLLQRIPELVKEFRGKHQYT